ncbi:hypothetical protein [Pseudoalteromonas maricaloris]|uniref:hypothetical protein n=1 Tax=Pseudoalteromonas maricaloris TaxID=184924 RepID=UPI00057F6098|nr:hypothetical protein [Pseudoalteromonas flavipulchra]KID33286.1 coiled-coil protein [Pseudoalteromonas flavipulchra NCIMB 2033 = ATCC BAA-314]MBD0781817.1 hypothetical protein [Pseudoalteromonas flavipulchra]MBE0373153.1 hypothetical protein [Pseudoalteromonas flavipulchra NCIMB 2033 = ATCC BAA-314]
MNIYFTDYFGVPKEKLDDYGAFNVSLINDLPVFIDPFLLFSSEKDEYQKLHQEIIKYITFLREMSDKGAISKGLIQNWFLFPEVKQNWLGYSKVGNGGSGLGSKFASALNENLSSIFNNFGNEQLTKSSHLEKLCLIKDGVGKDSISDFTTNLIKGFLCEYTQNFAKAHIHNSRCKEVIVKHAKFDYQIRRWASKRYTLPYIDSDFVLLTPKDILTKDEAWINKNDIIGDFDEIAESIPNIELRAQINEYLLRQIPERANQRERNQAISKALLKFPVLIDHYIRYKEDHGNEAVALSEQKIKETEAVFIRQVTNLVEMLRAQKAFYSQKGDTFEEAYNRVAFLKQVIESNDGYRLFYVKGEPVKRESDLQLIFRLTWYAAEEDVNAEVNNGRGPVDYKISRGSKDSTLVEFKLASNSKLKQNLAKQVEVYKAANQTKKSIKVILYFSDTELERVLKTLKDLELKEGKELVLIDARATNKPSGSNTKN